jgi:uncharacterized protein (DUF2141 family)
MKAPSLVLSVAAAIAALLGSVGRPAAAEEACAGQAGPVKLNVEVVGLRDAKGQVAVTVYPDNPRRFLAPKGKLLRSRVPTKTPMTHSCFWLPAPAYYAVVIYHDANADSNFNRNAVGMPAEGFGFSNDAPARMGLPSFSSVRFKTVAGDNTIRIRMRYR